MSMVPLVSICRGLNPRAVQLCSRKAGKRCTGAYPDDLDAKPIVEKTISPGAVVEPKVPAKVQA